MLSKHGIPVQILEAEDRLDKQPRASVYGPPAITDLARSGIIDEVRRRGYSPTTIAWRQYEDHSIVMGFDTSVLKDLISSTDAHHILNAETNADRTSLLPFSNN